MGYTTEVERADELRRQGLVTWEEYADLLQVEMTRDAGDFLAELARGVRDRRGRLKALEDLVREIPKRD